MAFQPGKPLTSVILDEIGLEGLEGITLSGLWIRLSDSLQLPLPLLDRFQNQVWSVVLQCNKYLEFYEIPEPREKLKIWNRFAVTDPDYGLPISLTECPFTLYKCVPISDCEILGSCESYDTRKRIPFEEIKKMTLKDIDEKWSETFVIVGNQKLRYNCLVPPNISIPTEITSTQYCVLELIGRSRHNGIASAGKFSVLHCCRDSAIGFYIRNKLLRLGLITRQPYTEKRVDRLISSSLLTLTRFHSQNKTAFNAVIEKLFFALKHTPNQQMQLTTVRHLFPPENQAMIKKILLTHFFRKFFETIMVPIKNLPDIKRTPKMNIERELICIRLKNPNLSEDELFNDNEDTDEKDSKDFYDYKHAHSDMPLKEEIYRAIEKHGSKGCSQSQLCAVLSMNHLNVRQALKKTMADKLVTSYCKDMGRQRTNMVVAANCSTSVKRVKEENINITKNLKCNDEPKLPVEADPPLKDIPQITSNIKKVTQWKTTRTLRDETAKQIERKQKIVEVVNENGIMQVPLLRQEMIRCEIEAGYKDEICNKSLYRTITRLQKIGIVNLFEISLRIEDNARLYRYVTHPKITADHIVIQQEIIKLKNALFLYLEERKFRSSSSVKVGQQPKAKVSRLGLIPAGPHKAPKFLTARFLHEFMFYMLNQLKSTQQPLELSEDLLKSWLQSEPNINLKELYESMVEEHIAPYRERINWRTFITPLPVYEGKPFGWMSLPDVVDRMPFSLLNKIIHVPPGVDPTAMEYLLHPVRQHYLIKQLPLSMQALINRSRLSRILVNIVRVLHRMGLIQLSEKGGKDALQLWVYLNRKATIVDTTTSEAGYLKINPERDYPKIKLNLDTYSEIQQYWNCLHKICVHTKLGFVHMNPKSRIPSIVLYKVRRNELNSLVGPVSSFEEAPLLDVGKPPGDGLGAGGITSALYSSFQRNWTWLVNNKHTIAAVAAAQKLKKSSKYVRTKLSKIITPTAGGKISTGLPPTMTVKKVNRFAMTTAGRVIKRKGTIVKLKRSKHPVDSVDRDALKQMRSLRARWTTKEDLILKLARATFLFLAVPVLHFSHRDVAKITRDIIRLHCGIYNKTTQACHRRIQFLVKTNRHLPELPTWLHAMQTNEHLTARYEGDKFFRDLRKIYPTKPDFRNALFVHFLYAFTHMQAQLDMSDPQKKGKLKTNFPDTLTEFYKKYRECSPLNENTTLLHFNPTTKVEVQSVTINNVLHSSLCCVRDKTQYNLQIFEIFKTFSEDILHSAFKKARHDGLVVSRKRAHLKTYTTQLSGPSYVFSNKYRLSLMFLRIPYVIYDMLHAFLGQTLKTIFDATQPAPVEIKSPHSAQLFFIGELLWNNYINIDIKTPSNMLTIDPTAQQSSITASERIFDHYHNLLENAPQTEYLKQFEALGDLASRVKLKAANEKYMLYYNPYDIICKLNTVQIHFFCFLDNLNRVVDLSFSQYAREPENFCPFAECIMRSGNYLNAIEKIVNNRCIALGEIHEDSHMDTDTEEHSVTIGVENILAVFEKFQTFLTGKLAQDEIVDIGKINVQRQRPDLVAICNDILRLDNEDEPTNNDEFEPALNKEEKIARAQDVFVVNLPTLQISANEEVLQGMERIKYKGVMVPEPLMEVATKRDVIFDKLFEDTYWAYTQNSLDTLKPVLASNGFSEAEQEKVVEIHDFIESNEIGAHASDLLEHFPDVEFLKRALKMLREHYLVLRTGVSTFMYVQKNHVRQWVIHTRHIKRLARESMGKLIPSRKRKQRSEEDENTDDTDHVAKCSKSTEEGRRISKPVVRFEDRKEVTTSSLANYNDPKDLLILKPCPWIRVNGSLNRRVLDKWMASIVIECTVHNGYTVHAICLRFRQMPPVHIMFLLELMVDLKIVELRSYKPIKVGLSSTFKELEISGGNEFTDPRNTFIIVGPDAVTRMSIFIGDKQYRSEFI